MTALAGTTTGGDGAGPGTGAGTRTVLRRADLGAVLRRASAPDAPPRAAGADDLAVAGLTPLSTVDWPGRLVATVFLQGCPWRCTYCHNPELLDPRRPGAVPWQTVRDLVGRRHGLLDAVVFSGGEPTRQAGLAAALREVRAAGLGVGLHTGGAFPGRLAEVLPLVDWVGLDVKAPPRLYRAVTRVGGPATSADAAFRSLRLVLAAGVAFQVRTTVDPTVLGQADLDELRGLLRDAGVRDEDHVLQAVRPEGTAPAYRTALAASAGRGCGGAGR